jgi:hypothetical protein
MAQGAGGDAMKKLLTPARANAKMFKGDRDYEAAILHLAPADLAGYGSVCPWASEGCKAACLNTSGRGQMTGALTLENAGRYAIQRARIERTRRFFQERPAFLAQLNREISLLSKRAAKRGVRAVVRLNGTSDIPWESFGVPQAHPEVTFYDYTKSAKRALAAVSGGADWPSNYTLTYSRRETDRVYELREMLRSGVNVAAVFATLPATAFGSVTVVGYPVIDGLAHDFRFEDPRGVVVGLLPKGRAKRDHSGFVIWNT